MPIPEEYGDKNEHSGNADNFNQLTNRQLYNVYNGDLTEPLYLRRQVFDYYDFENHRWYDLVRTGKAVETLGIKEFQLLFPIPDTEITKSKKILVQNPGY